MSNNISYEEKCKKELERLSEQYLKTNQTFENLMQLRDFQVNNNDLINISTSFFSQVIENSIEVLFIEISKMYDCCKNAIGIHSLLIRMKKEIRQLNNKKIIQTNVYKRLNDSEPKPITYNNIEGFLNNALCQIDNKNEIIERVKNLRDVYYAHSDKTRINTINDYFMQNSVDFDDIEELLTLNFNLYNALLSYFKNTLTLPLAVNYDDFKYLVKYLREGKESDNEKYATYKSWVTNK